MTHKTRILPALLALCLVTGMAAAQVPTKIMPLGDSITEGDYRFYMYNSLVAKGFAHGSDFDFIGSENGGTAAGTWDKDHEGHGGFTTDQLITGRGNPPGGGLSQELAAGTFVVPDVVCLLTGTNDIGYDWGKMYRVNNNGIVDPGESIPEYALHETIDNIRDVVGWLRARNPNVKIALSTGIPSLEERRHYAPATLEALKDEIVKLVDGTYEVPADLAGPFKEGQTGAWPPIPDRPDPSEFIDGGISTEDSPVILVDHWTGFDAGNMLIPDGVHPNDAGNVYIGQQFADAIEPWVVPEPASMSLLATGGLALLLRRRR